MGAQHIALVYTKGLLSSGVGSDVGPGLPAVRNLTRDLSNAHIESAQVCHGGQGIASAIDLPDQCPWGGGREEYAVRVCLRWRKQGPSAIEEASATSAMWV